MTGTDRNGGFAHAERDAIEHALGCPGHQPATSDETLTLSMCPVVDWTVEHRKGDWGTERLTIVVDRDQADTLAEILAAARRDATPRPKLFDR